MRKLTLNGLLWTLDREALLPDDSANADFIGEYNLNNSDFGDKYKPNRRPEAL